VKRNCSLSCGFSAKGGLSLIDLATSSSHLNSESLSHHCSCYSEPRNYHTSRNIQLRWNRIGNVRRREGFQNPVPKLITICIGNNLLRKEELRGD